MEKRRIRDQIGVLEEQLEVLDEISLDNELFPLSEGRDFRFGEDLLVRDAQESLRRLQDLVRDQSLQKSVPSQDFLKRVAAILIREAASANLGEIALTTHGTGRISLDMVEVAMGAILACLRASIKSFQEMSAEARADKRLFPALSFGLEIHGTPEEVRFRLIDDGPGHRGSFREFEGEKLFHRLRSHISRYGGWFNRRALPEYGGAIEFRLPMPTGRFEGLLLKHGENETLLPASCLAEVREGGTPARADQRLVAVLDDDVGLRLRTNEPIPTRPVWVRVAIADFEFWILCAEIVVRVKCRMLAADGFVEPGTWFVNFGAFQHRSVSQVLPLLEGEALMRFYLENRREDEGN